jgi:2-polyprenyl-3-methyl-5-hydroxy-6-metoxy-1,4-benzoquinol methylase
MSANAEFAHRTRAVFHAHHSEQAEHAQVFRRLTTLIDPSYFGIGKDFSGMRILDAGCGSNGNATYGFLQHGADFVTAMDVGSDWMQTAAAQLAPFETRFELKSGDLLDPSLDVSGYDFVHCAGVLHHTNEPRQAFAALVRATRQGGHTYISIMGTGNGVLYMWINQLRSLYFSDAAFKAMIDNLEIDAVREYVQWLSDEIRAQEELTSSEERALLGLVDSDLILTIKDRLQAPTYHDFRFREHEIRQWFTDEGYTDIRRIARYTRGFKNLRKYLAPLYLNYEHPVSKLLFGDGYIQMIGRKL